MATVTSHKCSRPDTLAHFEGYGTATLTTGPNVPVRFTVTQRGDGHLIGACAATGDLYHGDVCEVKGTTDDGWEIAIECETFDNAMPWRATVELTPRTVEATAPDAASITVATVTAPLLNFVFPSPSPRLMPPLAWRGYELAIGPLADYGARVDRLRDEDGIAQTAVLSVATFPPTTAKSVHRLFSEVTTPLSLASGRIVAMPLAQIEGEDGDVIASHHSNVIAHPFQTQADGFGFTSNPVKLVAAWNDREDAVFPLDYLRKRFHQFLDAGSTRLFLDSRAILSVALLDTIGTDYYVARNRVTRKMCKHDTTFKQRLEDMVSELGVDIGERTSICSEVTDIRNALIHDGQFTPSGKSGAERAWEMIQAQWLAYAFLTRLVDPTVGIRPIFDPRIRDPQFNPIHDLAL